MLYYTNKENALEWLTKGVKDRCASSTCLLVVVGSQRATSMVAMPLSHTWRLISPPVIRGITFKWRCDYERENG